MTKIEVVLGQPSFISWELRAMEVDQLQPKRLRLILMPVLALCMCSASAMAGALFSDLGPAGSVYNAVNGWAVFGSANLNVPGTSYITANLFTVAGSGSLSVTQIDLAVGNQFHTVDTFYASIWTDSAGLPGTEVTGADWNLSTSMTSGFCCGLVSVTGITGVGLAGGQQYFMVLGPLSLSDDSENSWNWNNQGATGLDIYSSNGGSSWTSNGTATLGAFDIIGTPEPGSLLLMGAGLIGMLALIRKRRCAPGGNAVLLRR